MIQKILISILVIAIAGCCFGCRKPSVPEVSGTYQRVFLGVSEKMMLNQNGSFTQTITYADKQSWSTDGNWTIKNRGILFDSYYVYWNMETMTPVIPPKHTDQITFEAIKGGLSREFQVVLKK